MRLARNFHAIRAFHNALPLSCLTPRVTSTGARTRSCQPPSLLSFQKVSSACKCTCDNFRPNHRSFVTSSSLGTISQCGDVHRNYSGHDPLPQGETGNDAKSRIRTLDQVVYHMQADIKRKRRIHKAEIHNAIELVEEASKVESFGVFLLNCCSDIMPNFTPSYRVKLAERIWAVIRKSKEYSHVHFEAMLKTLALNEDTSNDPFAFLEEAKSVGLNISGTMYFFALFIVCQRGDLESAVKILNTMKDNMVSVNERFFNALMLGNMRAGDYNGATEILNIMRASQIEPSIHTWCTLLQIHIEMGNLKQVKKMLSEVGRQFTEDQFYDLLKVAGKQDNQDVMDLVIAKALDSGKVHAQSLTNLILQLSHLGYPQNAAKMIFEFENVLRRKEELLGTFFIKELHFVDNITDPDAYLNLIVSLQGYDRNPYALNIATESVLKHKKFELAYKIFEGMQANDVPVRPHYFLPAFITETENNGTLGGVGVLRQMRRLGVQLDWEMLLNWVIPFLFKDEGNMIETLRIIKEVCDLSYSSGLFSAGLIVALQERKIHDAVALAENCKGKIANPEAVIQSLFSYICDVGCEKDLSSIAKLIECVSKNKPLHDKQDYVGIFIVKLLKVDRSEEAELLIKQITEQTSKQLPVSAQAAEFIMDKLKFTDNLQVDSTLIFNAHFNGDSRYLVHVQDMNTTDLECHKQELEAKEMNTRGTSRKLFLKCCSSGSLDKVLESKSSFEKVHGPLSHGMKAALMGAYIRNGALEPAMQLFHELIDSKSGSDVVIDVYKIIDLATLMVENGLAEEAIELIMDKCPTKKVHRTESISRNIVRLLEAVSKSEFHNDHVLDLTKFFLKLRFIKCANPTLAPSIKNMIRHFNLEAAVSLLEEYTQQYSLAPCLQELTYAVLENPNLLERVFKCSTQTKGEREAKRLLALAKADMGDIDGAARDFMELGSDLSFASIIKQCEYLSSKQDIQKVLNLICALQKTGQNYDCRRLYEIAIQGCKRADDKEGLKRVLSYMEEQDIYISTNLKEFSSHK